MKRLVLSLFFALVSIPLLSEPIRYKVDGYEFYFLKDQNLSSRIPPTEMISGFAEQFILEFAKEAERLNLKKPSGISVFISENPKIFSQTTGQPSFVAARFFPESQQFHFQNPDILKKRNIFLASVRHEICHYFSPHSKELNWLEESYCEALYPTNPIIPRKFLVFPESWEKFKKFNSDKSSKKEVELRRYKLLSSWGNWILKNRGEIRFRNLLNDRSSEKEWEMLYSKFLISQ